MSTDTSKKEILSTAINPTVKEALVNYCTKEDRTPSFIINKALVQFLQDKIKVKERIARAGPLEYVSAVVDSLTKNAVYRMRTHNDKSINEIVEAAIIYYLENAGIKIK